MITVVRWYLAISLFLLIPLIPVLHNLLPDDTTNWAVRAIKGALRVLLFVIYGVWGLLAITGLIGPIGMVLNAFHGEAGLWLASAAYTFAGGIVSVVAIMLNYGIIMGGSARDVLAFYRDMWRALRGKQPSTPPIKRTTNRQPQQHHSHSDGEGFNDVEVVPEHADNSSSGDSGSGDSGGGDGGGGGD
jgi:hypothetical protein